MTKTVREFSAYGPCITKGVLVKETAQFYFFEERFGNAPTIKGKVMKRTEARYSRAHVEPCPSCRDHAATQYPNGLMD